jgi:K+-sensing histidine kinase KdpD
MSCTWSSGAVTFLLSDYFALPVLVKSSGIESLGMALSCWCRVSHPGAGLPDELVLEMYDKGKGMTQEGLGLNMCRKLVRLMNGDVQYVRDNALCYFVVYVELPMAQRDDAASQM